MTQHACFAVLLLVLGSINAAHCKSIEAELESFKQETHRVFSQWPNWFQSASGAKIFLRDVLDSLPIELGNTIRARAPDIFVDTSNRRECATAYRIALTVHTSSRPTVIVCARGLAYAAKASAIINTYASLGLGIASDPKGEALARALDRLSEDIANGHLRSEATQFGCTALEYVFSAVKRLPMDDCLGRAKGPLSFSPLLLLRFQFDSMNAATQSLGGPKQEPSDRDLSVSPQHIQDLLWATDEFATAWAIRVIGQYAAMHELGHIAAAHDKLQTLTFLEEYQADAFAIDYSETALFPRLPKGASLVYAKGAFEASLFVKYAASRWGRRDSTALDQRMDESIRFVSCYAIEALGKAKATDSRAIEPFLAQSGLAQEFNEMSTQCATGKSNTAERARSAFPR